MDDDWTVWIKPAENGRGYSWHIEGRDYYTGWYHTWTLKGAIRKSNRMLARLRRWEARKARAADQIEKAGY